MEKQYAQWAADRKMIYEFISGLCLRPPTEAMISMIRDGSIMELVQADPKSEGRNELEKFVKLSAGMSGLQNELDAEHTSLFMMPGDVIPHEAAFLDRDQKVGAGVTISVENFYKSAGADILSECIQMPDHIGMELEFMEFLCGIESEARRKGDIEALKKCIEFQGEFLEDHLLKWAFQWSEEVLNHSQNGFYRAVALLASEFLREEEEYVTNLNMTVKSGEEEICEITI